MSAASIRAKVAAGLRKAIEATGAANSKKVYLIQEVKVSGQRVSAAQTSMLPRAFMYGNGFLISDDVIPDEFKRAQVMAAAVVNEGVDLNAYDSGGDLSGFSVDGVYSETYQPGGTSPSVKMPAVEKTLSGFFDNVGTLSRGNYW